MRRALRWASAAPALHLVAAAGASGLASYVYLIIVARAVAPEVYSEFSVFWSVAVIAGLGVFLPLEQEIARSEAAAQTRSRGVSSFSAALQTGLLLVLVGGTAAVLLIRLVVPVGADPVAVAVAAAFVAYAPQFVLRGLYSGERHVSAYAAMIAVEAGARVALPLVALAWFPGSLLALALVVAFASAASVLMIGVVRPHPAARVSRATFGSHVLRLVAGALMVQLLLNFAPLVAATGGVTSAVPGILLATVSLARIPVFIYQSLQGAIVPAIAQLAARGDRSGATRRVGLVIGGASLLAVVWGVALSVVGESLLTLLFGSAFRLPGQSIVLVASAMGILLVAIATSDCVMALGGHSFVTLTWIASATVAIGLAFTITDSVTRSTLPVVVGGGLAFATLVGVVVARIRTIRPRPDKEIP